LRSARALPFQKQRERRVSFPREPLAELTDFQRALVSLPTEPHWFPARAKMTTL
jgi:hypothetical protein